MESDINSGVTRIRDQLCPFCGYHFDAVSTHDGTPGTPAPGDASVCLHCTEAMVFGDDGLLRVPTAEERGAFARGAEWESLRLSRAMLKELQRQGFRTGHADRGNGSPH